MSMEIEIPDKEKEIAVRLESICERAHYEEPLTEDERYIYECVRYLNVHKTAEENVKAFMELAEELGLFDTPIEYYKARRLEKELKELKAGGVRA